MERKAKLKQLTSEQIKNLRLEKSLPIINHLGKWIFEEIKNTFPKSQIGKAFAYAYARWDALSAYLYEGNLKIDNNLCENALRGIAWVAKITCSQEVMKLHKELQGSIHFLLSARNTISILFSG